MKIWIKVAGLFDIAHNAGDGSRVAGETFDASCNEIVPGLLFAIISGCSLESASAGVEVDLDVVEVIDSENGKWCGGTEKHERDSKKIA